MNILYKAKKCDKYLPVGFKDIDVAITGLLGNEFVLVGGRPMAGKTSFMLNIGLNLSTKGASIGFFIIDDPIALKRWPEFKNNSFIDFYFHKIDSGIDLSTVEIISKKKAYDFIFIDSLQAIKLNHYPLYSDRIDDLSHRLKHLARGLHTRLIVSTYLGVEVEKRNNSIPILIDLPESGCLEEDADKVFFICRKDNVAKIIIAKNRSGNVGECLLKFDGRIFYDKEQENINFKDPNYKLDDKIKKNLIKQMESIIKDINLMDR